MPKKDLFPRELKGKVSPSLAGYAGKSKLVSVLGIGLSIFALYGPMVGPPDHNIVLYLFGSLACPNFAALLLTVFPFRPYRGSPFVRPGTKDVDTSDPQVIRLVEIYQPSKAWRFLWYTAAKISGILLASMGVLTVSLTLAAQPLNWSFSSPWFWHGMLGCCLFSWLTLGVQYIAWGFKQWTGDSIDNLVDSCPLSPNEK